MTFHPLNQLFEKKSFSWDESDIKYFIQRFLSAKLSGANVVCEGVLDGRVTIRVNSPALKQEVLMAEHNLCSEVEKQTGYKISHLTVTM